MPANKNQIRRIQTIVKMMRQNRYPNYPRFLKEMEKLDIAGAYQKTSSKTFQRDIADLRDEYGAPVHYDESRKGYYLANTDWYNEDLMVEPYEMKAALLGERIASGFLPQAYHRSGDIARITYQNRLFSCSFIESMVW
jgi:predicted DNA-binding transcriptional regulator YafY